MYDPSAQLTPEAFFFSLITHVPGSYSLSFRPQTPSAQKTNVYYALEWAKKIKTRLLHSL